MVLNVHRNHKGLLGTGSRGKGRGYGGGGKGRLYTYRYTVTTDQNDSCIKMGRDGSYLNVSLVVGDKVARQCPQTTTFEEKGNTKPKRIRTELPLLTNLTPCR